MPNRQTTSDDYRSAAYSNFYLRRRLKEQARNRQSKYKKKVDVLPEVFGSHDNILTTDFNQDEPDPEELNSSQSFAI